MPFGTLITAKLIYIHVSPQDSVPDPEKLAGTSHVLLLRHIWVQQLQI